jgi:uncharacterized protein DUF1858/uncharacterized protein DUF542/NnrS protein
MTPVRPIDPRLTVAEIVRLHPAAAPILARFGLDTCCGGSHPLEFACRAHKVDLAEVLRALEATVPARPFDGAPPAACGAASAAHEPAPMTIELPGGRADRGDGRRRIAPEMTLREIIAAWPATATVFARHGLMGCGGMEGPVEPVGWFAKVHHVDLPSLLDELEEVVASGAAPAAPVITPDALARENLYRRFLKAALLFTFTGGTALGAWALVVMALRERLGGIGRGVIQVHGHWQLFGWVGLFVVGVAYHILPRLTAVPLPSYRLASWSFVALTVGTVMRFGQSLDPSMARNALLLGGALLEIAGCAIFAWTVGRILTLQASRLMPYQVFLGHGTVWLLVSALLNLAHARDLVRSGRFEVSAWLNVPYLSIFLLGFVTFWILGVSLRTLPVFMGLRNRSRAAAIVATPLSAAIALLAVGEALFLKTGGDAPRSAFGIGGLAVACCLALFTWALGILSPAHDDPEPGADRGYEKFIRLSYAWLLISGLMLAVFSVLILAGRDLDHAYVGAYRHALTVGFITTIMVGMALRIVPVFRGVPLWSPRMREATFWLLAIGNVIRVVFQALSAAAGPQWLRVAGISGLMELTALALFGVNLWKTMDSETAEDRAAAGWRPPIAPETRVGDLLDAYPALLPVFVGSGFAPLANPVLRRTLARGVSISQACRMHGVDLEGFLGRLRSAKDAGGR